MRRIIGLTLLILAAAGLWVWFLQPGLTPTERLLVWRSHSAVFTPDGWRAGDARARGGMLHDLLQRKRLVGAMNDEVFALLGPPTCYANYEDEPCYAVELSGEKRHLVIGVNHSDRPGVVVGLGLRWSGRPRVALPSGTRHGCSSPECAATNHGREHCDHFGARHNEA